MRDALAGSLAGAGIESAHRADFADATHVVFAVVAFLLEPVAVEAEGRPRA